MTTIRLHHVSLMVTELERARSFYEGILGLRPNPDRPIKSFDGVWYDIGTQQIHLIVRDAGVASTLPSPETYGGMDRHTALIVSNLEPIRTRLEKAGLRHTPSRSGRPVIFCRDPDGNGFELIGEAP